MGKRDLPTVKVFFEYEDGHSVPWDSISENEQREINKNWLRRLEMVMSDYYRQHPEYLALLPETSPEAEKRYYELFPEKKSDHLKAVANT